MWPSENMWLCRWGFACHTHGFSSRSSCSIWQNRNLLIESLHPENLLSVVTKLWISLSSLAALFDVRVFKMATLAHFYSCNCFHLIISAPKSYLSPIRNLKLCAPLQGSLTSPNGQDSFRVSWMCTDTTVQFWLFCMILQLQKKRRGLLCSTLKYKPDKKPWEQGPDSQISFSQIFSTFQQCVIASLGEV